MGREMIKEGIYEYVLSWLIPELEKQFEKKYAYINKPLRGFYKHDKSYSVSKVIMIRAALKDLICYGKTNQFLTDGYNNRIYVYNGVYFEQIDEANAFLKELLVRIFKDLDFHERYCDEIPAKSIAKSIFDTLSSSDKYLYKPNKRYVAFRDAVYDLEKCASVKPSCEQCPAIILDLNYANPTDLYKMGAEEYGTMNNPCRLWKDKIKEIIPNDDARDVFQQWCGTLLADKNVYKTEYVLFLVGPGSNGKSVVSSTIANVFGQEYFSCFSFRQLFKDSDRNVNIAALAGKVANFIDDMDGNEVSGGDFKRFASGGEFQGRGLYEKKVVKVTAPPLLCCANSMPETLDDSFGGQRRRLVVHTTETPFVGERRDTQLTYKLTQPIGLMYVFHWIVEGYKKFVKNGGDIVMGDDMKKAQERVMANSNNMRRWWEDGCYEPVESKDLDNWHSIKNIYAEYKEFCRLEGSEPCDSTKLSAMLREKKCCYHRMANGFGFCFKKKTGALEE